MGTARLPGLTTVAQAGIFVTSPDSVTNENAGATLASGVFDHVTVAGARPGDQWAGQDLGAAAAYHPLPGGYRQADGVFTVRGSGDIAPAVRNSAGSGSTADAGITGVFAGLIVVLVVGTMFITAEYRCGLIRTTLAATPRRGQVLAAKAIVTAAVAFVAGLVGSAAAVLVGGDMALGVIWRHGAGPVTAADWLLRVTPAAGFALQQVLPAYPQVSNTYTPQYGYYPRPPWAGFAVLCAWTAAALLAGGLPLRLRDA